LDFRVQPDGLQLEPQLVLARHDPAEAGAELVRALVERANEIVPLPDHPGWRAADRHVRVDVEVVADEVLGLELHGPADGVIALEAVAECIDLDLVGPVAAAWPLVVEVGARVGWQIDEAVAAQERVLDAGAVHVDLRVLVAAVAQPALAADAELVVERLAAIVVVAAD